MGDLAHVYGSPHGLQYYRIAEQLVHRLVDREVLGNERRHAVVDQKINIALLVPGIGSKTAASAGFRQASDTVRPPGLDAVMRVGRSSSPLYVVCTKP